MLNGNTTSGYENAPATTALATSCACCGRPLVDAESVESGMGPTCRKKHGFGVASSEPDWEAAERALAAVPTPARVLAVWLNARAVVNALVNTIACGVTPTVAAAYVDAIAALGFKQVAIAIGGFKIATVIVTRSDMEILVEAPYDPDACESFRAAGGRWNGATRKSERAWVFPATAEKPLLRALKQHFHGHTAVGAKGSFVL